MTPNAGRKQDLSQASLDSSLRERSDELEFDDKLILVEFFDNDAELMAKLVQDGGQPEYDSLAYCETYSDDTKAWGKLYFLKDVKPSTVAHESVHLASGILARKHGKPKGLNLWLTTETATDTEEELAAIVEGITQLLTDHLFMPKALIKSTLKGVLGEKELPDVQVGSNAYIYSGECRARNDFRDETLSKIEERLK
jgi:hypothetical protein